MTDEELIGILRISDEPSILHAANRIEALLKEVKDLRDLPDKAEKFALLHIQGGVEPSIYGDDQPSWEAFEDHIQEFLTKSNYDDFEDGLFCIELNKNERLVQITSFSNSFIDDMKKAAGLDV